MSLKGRDGTPLRPVLFSDAAIVGRVRSGETEAFSELVRKYQSRLMRHIARRVSDGELAKDLCQEVWFRAYRGIKRFRCDSAFYSWVYRIAENVIKDHFRQQTHAESLEPLHLIDDRRLIDTAACPSVYIIRSQRCFSRRLVSDCVFCCVCVVLSVSITSKQRPA